MIKKEVLNVLICPFCKSDCKQRDSDIICTNPECLCVYRIEDDIPVMLIDEANRSCPKCGSQRDWIEERNLLRCPKCFCELKGRV
ncbi:MAG: hypothetical protein V1709_04700 [Planctomycetota bacterium]